MTNDFINEILNDFSLEGATDSYVIKGAWMLNFYDDGWWINNGPEVKYFGAYDDSVDELYSIINMIII